MKANNILALAMIFTGFIVSCKKVDNNSGILSYENNIDEMFAWNENNRSGYLQTAIAHSGVYVNVIEKNSPFSTCFYMKLGDIAPERLKSVKVSGWVLRKNPEVLPTLVIDILDKDRKSIEYAAKDARSVIRNNNQWYEVMNEMKLNNKIRNNPKNYIKVYFINYSDHECWIDDISIRFEQ